MRVVGGRLRGRPLATPKDNSVRPTSDRVRQAIFNILEHSIDDFQVDGMNVLDLFAGTGALGIEALSRGAAQCVFVDNDPSSRALVQQNIETLGLGGIATIFRRSALDLGTAYRRLSFGLVFADPPYGNELGEAAIGAAIASGWVADGAAIIIEESETATIHWPADCKEIDNRHYGSTQVAIARYQPDGDAAISTPTE